MSARLKLYAKVGGSLVVAAALAAGGIRLHQARLDAVERISPPAPSPWAVRTSAVTRGRVERGFPVLATVTAREEVTVTGQVSGTLLEMGPREGVAVEAGQLLARVDTRQLEEQRAALVASVDAARADAKRLADDRRRTHDLLARGTISESVAEAAGSAAVGAAEKVRSLERQIKSLDVRIGFGTITAPADGVIAARLAEPGDICQVGHPLYRLTLEGGARVEVEVPQAVRERVAPGTMVVLRHGDPTRRVRITRVNPALDPLALGSAEADLPEIPFGLPSGARVPALVVLDSVADALRVVPSALLRPSGTGNGTVFKVTGAGSEARLAAVPVEVLLEGREAVAVKGDLSEGDRVVSAHESVLLRLRDGDPVLVEAEEPAR